MKEPLSTISSLLFALLGALIAWLDESSQLLIAFLVLLGVGSAAHHASGSEKNTPAHKLDEWSIYGVAAALLYHAWFEIIWVIVAAAALLGYAFLKLREIDLFESLPILMAAIAGGIVVTAGLLDAAIVTAVAAAGLAVRTQLENTDLNHTLWHLLATISIGLAWYLTK